MKGRTINTTRILDGPETCTCVGPIVTGRCKHMVLAKGNNVKACHGCMGNVCGMRQVYITNRNNDNDDSENEAILCLPCYSGEKLGIRGPTDENDIITVQQMREELAYGGYELDANATYIEIDYLYEMLCMKTHFATFKDNNGHDLVPFSVKKKPNRKTPQAKKYCCFHECCYHELTDEVTILRLQKIPNELSTDASVKRTSTCISSNQRSAPRKSNHVV